MGDKRNVTKDSDFQYKALATRLDARKRIRTIEVVYGRASLDSSGIQKVVFERKVTERNVYSEFHHSKYTTYLTTCFTTKCGDSRPSEVHLKIW